MNFARRGAHPIYRNRGTGEFHPLGNLDPLLNALVGRNDEVATLANAELADYGDVRAAQNAKDLALCAALVRYARNVYQGAIAMHPFRRFAGRQEDIAVHALYGSVRNQKPESIAMNGKPSRGIFGIRAHRHEMTGAQFDQQSLLRQPVEHVFQRIPLSAIYPQLAD